MPDRHSRRAAHRRWERANRTTTDVLLCALFVTGIVSTISVFGGLGPWWPAMILSVPVFLSAVLAAVHVLIETLVYNQAAGPLVWGLLRYWRWALVPVATIGFFSAIVSPMLPVLAVAAVLLGASRLSCAATAVA